MEFLKNKLRASLKTRNKIGITKGNRIKNGRKMKTIPWELFDEELRLAKLSNPNDSLEK